MKILVTGASGFIGLAITRRLQATGHEVIAFSKTYRITGSQDIVGDVRDRALVQQVVAERKPEAVIYCASRPRTCMTEAARASARIAGVLTVKDATRGLPFLYLSSTKVVTDPCTSYAEAQRRCEDIVTARGGSVLRLPAVYGPGRRPWLRYIGWLCPKRVRSLDSVVKEITAWLSASSSF